MKARHLFRGKRLDNGEWAQGYIRYRLVDGDLSKTKQTCIIYWDEMDSIGKAYCYTAEVDFATIGQCTGLRDKNDKLIFEGDILVVNSENHPDTGTICIVKFGGYKHGDAQSDYVNGDFGFYLDWYGKSRKLLRKDMLYWQGNGYVEAVGNIYDNPELLKAEG